MVAWSDLLLPSLLAAVLVFVVSSFVHMVLKWHNADYKKLVNEDEVRAVIRKGSPGPGVYILPHCLDHKQLASPEMSKKFEEGPNGLLELKPSGKPALGPHLAKWFVYSVVISLLAGYVGRITLPIDAQYMSSAPRPGWPTRGSRLPIRSGRANRGESPCATWPTG
jgi:hypothetical protein